MKIALCLSFFLAVAAPHVVMAKDPPISAAERTVVQVYPAEGMTKDQIYSTARQWIAESFRSSKAVIEYDNRDEGTIIGNGSMRYPCTGAFSCMAKADWKVSFTMKIEAKDGRFRTSFSNIRISWPASYNSGIATAAADFEPYHRKDLETIRPALLLLSADLAARMGKAAQPSNW